MVETADRILVSYPADLSTWGRDVVEGYPFQSYLPRAHDTAAVGDRWEEFVGVGCCGNTLDVPLRVETVEGGNELAAETTIDFTARDACGVGGWSVQSEAGP